MLSNHCILCCPLLQPSIFPSIRVFSNESVLHIRWPKYWSFSISPSNEYSELISFRIGCFDLLAVQGTLQSLLQHHSSNASIFWREQDGGGVGGHGVYLSPWIHQEYTIRHGSACTTPAKSGQEYLTSGKEYTDPHKLGRTNECISFLMLSLLYGPTLTSIHDYWKTDSFDYTDLCQQSDVSAF